MKTAAEFNELTKKGIRTDTGIEACKIWIRKVFKKIIKKEFFIIVATNISELELNEDNKQRLGQVLDRVFNCIEDKDFTGKVGYRIDELIRSSLPSLIRNSLNLNILNGKTFLMQQIIEIQNRVRNSGFGQAMNMESRVQIDGETNFSRNEIQITKDEALIDLAKISSIRWETLAYIKSGCMKGTNFGTVSNLCFEQIGLVNHALASVIGDDASLLGPGYYSKLFRSGDLMFLQVIFELEIFIIYYFCCNKFYKKHPHQHPLATRSSLEPKKGYVDYSRRFY